MQEQTQEQTQKRPQEWAQEQIQEQTQMQTGKNIHGMVIDMNIMQDDSEVVHYDRSGVPLYIQERWLHYYLDMQAQCHWHEDFELIYIIDGVMRYQINGKRIFLEKGDSLLINARQMHFGFSDCHRDCDFICILFHPDLLSGNSTLFKEFVQPVMETSGMEFIHFTAEDETGQKMEQLQREILQYKTEKSPYYEMEVVSCLYRMWKMLLQEYHLLDCHADMQKDENLAMQRKMIDFIYQHYQEKLSLDDIARSAHVGRSKCCALFRRYLQITPIDFLNQYRLKVCCDLLTRTDKSITEIALNCGFNHLSYFSRLFTRFTGYTPRQYRTNCAGLEEKKD